MTRRPPNILIFMTDQEQAEVLLPDHPCQTPHASRLAAEGIQFTRAFCPTAHCCPSRASLMTGVYPSIHGIYNNVSNPTAIRRGLRPGVRMFSEGLREAGYRLQYAGKWHVTDEENPSDRGWEELVVTAPKGSYMHRGPERWREMARESRDRGETFGGRTGRGRGAPGRARPPAGLGRLPALSHAAHQRRPRLRRDARTGAWCRVACRRSRRLTKEQQPWCLYVGPIGPHDPFHVPQNFVDRYDPAQVPLPPSYDDDLEDKPRVYQRMRRQYWDQLGEDEIRAAVRHYWAYCTMEDTYFGLIMDLLEGSGQREDTLVLRLSDHGEYAGAHGLFCKGVPAFREGYNVPCILSWPAGIARPGRTELAFVTLADIAPTLLDVAGLPVPDGLTGRSLTPFLRAGHPGEHPGEHPDDWPDAFCSQMNGVELYYTQRAVQTDDWKYVYNGFDLDELYDLGADPHERVNLAGRPEYDEVKRDLVGRMWRFAGQTQDHIFNPYATVALAPWGPADAYRDD